MRGEESAVGVGVGFGGVRPGRRGVWRSGVGWERDEMEGSGEEWSGFRLGCVAWGDEGWGEAARVLYSTLLYSTLL